MKQIKICPQCGEQSIRTIWVDDRKLQYKCVGVEYENGEGIDCDWKSDPFIPNKKEIKTVKTIPVNLFYGYEYVVYDQYGHVASVSRTYDSAVECKTAALEDLQRTSAIPGYGNCTVVLWPKTVRVKGKILTLKDIK